MITINTLTILSDRKTMNVTVNAGTGLLINSVKLWDESTFKDYTLAKDFSGKLTQGSETEVFTITAAEVGVTEFNGLYFVEFENNDATPDVELGMVAETFAYEECKLDKILGMIYDGKDCASDCSSPEASDILNIDALLRALETSIAQGYIYESISLVNALKKLCTNSCNECPPLQNTGSSVLEVIETCDRTAFNISTLTEDHCLTYPPAVHVAVDNTAYHNGTGASPAIGDTVYATPVCTDDTKYPAGTYWDGTNHWTIDANGVVQTNATCV